MSKYAKRHYEDVAAILIGLLSRGTPESEQYARDIADEFVELFESDNPRFDRARFYQAAGIPQTY